MTPTKIRILLVDDHAVVRRGLRMVLDAEPDLVVVAEASDGAEALTAADRDAFDLAVLDVSMPRKTGLQTAAELSQRQPGVRIVMLSMHANEQYVYEALRAGASGYVLKSEADTHLVEACRAAMRGAPFMYPASLAALIGDELDRIHAGSAPRTDPLTPRELEVVKLIAEAWTSDGIALELGITRRTVDRHRENILAKLGMRDRVELTRYAIRRGLIEPQRAVALTGRGGKPPSTRMFGSRTLWAVARLLIFVQPPRYATPAELSFWLEGALAALGRDGVDRIRLRPLRTASLHSSSTWGWMIELDCHSVEAACAAAGEGSGMLLLEHLRMLGIRVNVALVEEAD